MDGIPDFWERIRGTDAADPADAGLDPDGDGYTHIEAYLFSVIPAGQFPSGVLEKDEIRTKDPAQVTWGVFAALGTALAAVWILAKVTGPRKDPGKVGRSKTNRRRTGGGP